MPLPRCWTAISAQNPDTSIDLHWLDSLTLPEWLDRNGRETAQEDISGNRIQPLPEVGLVDPLVLFLFLS